jgi:predicted RNase H-like HicB family nuclease
VDKMTQYIGVLDGSGKSYCIRIPDLPGCYGGGTTPEAALTDAMSAAREWINHRMIKNQVAPKPRSMAQILKAGEIEAKRNEVAVIVPVVLDEGRTVRANLTFDAGLLAAIDAEAERRGVTRSAFLASAARERLEVA